MSSIELRLKYKQETGDYPASLRDSSIIDGGQDPAYVAWLEDIAIRLFTLRDYLEGELKNTIK